MQFIPENDMAFDPDELGFPSIFGCQAVCVHTSRGLYGFHDYKSAKQGGRDHMTDVQISSAKLGQFATWVGDTMNDGETISAIYGIINRNNQYNSDTAGNNDWKTVLLDLADQLTFAGKVYGHRLNSNKHLPNDQSAYVKATLNGGVVSIGYKRWSKMKADHQNKITVDHDVHKRVVWRQDSFETENLYGSGKVSPVLRDHATKGENLNMIGLQQFQEFQ